MGKNNNPKNQRNSTKILIGLIGFTATVIITLLLTSRVYITQNGQEVATLFTSDGIRYVVIPLILISFGAFAGTWGILLLVRAGIRYFNAQIRLSALETQIKQEKQYVELIQSLREGLVKDVR